MTEHSRRAVIRAGIGMASMSVARAARASLPEIDDEELPLWPGIPPGGAGVQKLLENDKPGRDGRHNRRLTRIATPFVVVKRAPKPNGAAVVAIPGGGYSTINYDVAGTEYAAWLNAEGMTTFILVYRLPGEGWAHRADVPLQDAQRAIRLIRANAARFGIDPSRVAVLGSSAGGHVAGSLATRFDKATYMPVDASDALSARPDLAALLFPVITMGDNAHASSRDQLLGADSTQSMRDAYSLERHVSPSTPPTWICCAGDDPVVPAVNSLEMYRALLDAGLKAELHAFQKGGHGFGLRLPAANPASHWPELFLRFARSIGLLG